MRNPPSEPSQPRGRIRFARKISLRLRFLREVPQPGAGSDFIHAIEDRQADISLMRGTVRREGTRGFGRMPAVRSRGVRVVPQGPWLSRRKTFVKPRPLRLAQRVPQG